MSDSLKALLIEDSEVDARLIERALRKDWAQLECRRIDCRATLANALDEAAWDVILVDYHMPELRVADVIDALKERVMDRPLIVVSGALNIESAIELLRAGAHDFVSKDDLARLAPSIKRELRSAADRHENRASQAALRESEARLRGYLGDVIGALARAVEQRDPFTAGHQQRVARLAGAIARALGLRDDAIQCVESAGAIHDIGKVSIPAEIVNRPGPLNQPEREIVHAHAELGYEIMKDLKAPWPIAEVIRQHHERTDGSGYPRGLTGEQTLIEARILAVADVVEAMTAHRPYRPARSIDQALAEIEGYGGERYDARAARACAVLFRKEEFSFSRVGSRAGAEPVTAPFE